MDDYLSVLKGDPHLTEVCSHCACSVQTITKLLTLLNSQRCPITFPCLHAHLYEMGDEMKGDIRPLPLGTKGSHLRMKPTCLAWVSIFFPRSDPVITFLLAQRLRIL